MHVSDFQRINSLQRVPLMYQMEAEGLQALAQANLFVIPGVIGYGIIARHQYLLLEHISTASAGSNFSQLFATALVQLHRITNNNFGWNTSNYIGSLVQQNHWANSWAEFYANQRILPLAETLFNRGAFAKADVALSESICKQFHNTFPAEPPSLLHGDLWAGNFMAAKHGGAIRPCIYDPAVYFGHREMDLGMMHLFGGFDRRVFDFYHAQFPLVNDWRKRISLTQLYPLLVHAILFGGGYIQQCRNIIKEWAC